MKKYLLYAIGEIFLVVIGILIAINLNNSNQNRIAKKIRDDKVHKLRNDLYSDSIGLSRTIEFNKTIDSKLDSLLILFNSNMSFETYKQFRLKFMEANMNYRTTIPNEGIYNELINSGDFSNINDVEFKQLTTSFYILFNHFNDLINKFLDPILLTEKKLFTDGLLAHKYFLRNRSEADIFNDFKEFKSTFSDRLNKRILENHFYELKDLHQQIIYFYNVVVDDMQGIPLKPEKP